MSPLALFLGIPWKKFGGWMLKSELWALALLKPLGVWGLLVLSMLDSAAIPLPFLDPLIVSYGVHRHALTPLFCFMAAVGSAIGSMLPYYLGRAGGELFLLKRINRERYEQLRDRFEKQEFLAIMLPAMSPPPMPLKLFELAAGVFEMRPLSFFLAITAGKMVRFTVESILVILYGPKILGLLLNTVRHHATLVITFVGIVVVAIAVQMLRRGMARRSAALADGDPDADWD